MKNDWVKIEDENACFDYRQERNLQIATFQSTAVHPTEIK
jgi:hypothetical protein